MFKGFPKMKNSIKYNYEMKGAATMFNVGTKVSHSHGAALCLVETNDESLHCADHAPRTA